MALKKVMITMLVVLVSCFASYSANAASWLVPGDFPTIQAAIGSSLVIDGDRIIVGPGEHAGAFVNKAVEIKGEGGAIINAGPAHSSGMVMGFRLIGGSGGTTISHLTFKVDLAIMNGAAVNDITVTQCTFYNPVQAISNWRGSGWEISHNNIYDLRTRNGGGIGILVADYLGGTVAGNVISHNKISGTLHVAANDGGGYNGSGIVIYADFRWGRSGATAIKENRVVKNSVSLVSDNPYVVDIAAFELTDTRNTSNDRIFGNAIGFNDFRGTALQIDLSPDSLELNNSISRNLGENRGHGLHPSLFGPAE